MSDENHDEDSTEPEHEHEPLGWFDRLDYESEFCDRCGGVLRSAKGGICGGCRV